MQTYTALGLEVAFTELDIRMTLPNTDALLTQQSLDFENVDSACVNVDNCIGITVWDFDDKVRIFTPHLKVFQMKDEISESLA
jgi:endo-1,4-beta-xylanase